MYLWRISVWVWVWTLTFALAKRTSSPISKYDLDSYLEIDIPVNCPELAIPKILGNGACANLRTLKSAGSAVLDAGKSVTVTDFKYAGVCGFRVRQLAG